MSEEKKEVNIEMSPEDVTDGDYEKVLNAIDKLEDERKFGQTAKLTLNITITPTDENEDEDKTEEETE